MYGHSPFLVKPEQLIDDQPTRIYTQTLGYIQRMKDGFASRCKYIS